jgi:energy-coupling factor transporter transmembrane protein EcfT
MADTDAAKLFRPINQSLGQQPSLGPIPAHLLAPSAVILVMFYLVIVVVLSLTFAWFLLSSVWGVATWWVVVGERPWKFINKFVAVPDWTRGYVLYTACLLKD